MSDGHFIYDTGEILQPIYLQLFAFLSFVAAKLYKKLIHLVKIQLSVQRVHVQLM